MLRGEASLTFALCFCMDQNPASLPASGTRKPRKAWVDSVPVLVRVIQSLMHFASKSSPGWMPRTGRGWWNKDTWLSEASTSSCNSPIRSSKLLNECLLISCMLSARAREKSARAHRCPHLSSHCWRKYERRIHSGLQTFDISSKGFAV